MLKTEINRMQHSEPIANSRLMFNSSSLVAEGVVTVNVTFVISVATEVVGTATVIEWRFPVAASMDSHHNQSNGQYYTVHMVTVTTLDSNRHI